MLDDKLSQELMTPQSLQKFSSHMKYIFILIRAGDLPKQSHPYTHALLPKLPEVHEIYVKLRSDWEQKATHNSSCNVTHYPPLSKPAQLILCVF